ncbi:MAG: SRPBCC domain-containing protein [Kineosporiaceae bacterium]|nr:SRPBCC domain-containing protein [Kineosporiaceae bacterium]
MTPRHPLGKILRDEHGTALHFERELRSAPERVWRALTESDQLRTWMPCDIVGPREEGAEVMIPFWDDVAARYAITEPVLTGRIVTWDPPRRFAWTWDDELLTFELEPTATGTRLTLMVRLGAKGPGAALVGEGYHYCLDQLIDLVETEAPHAFLDDDARQFEQAYAAAEHAH